MAARMAKRIEYTAERYCDDVLSGRQVACKWVRLACERHRRDLATGAERGLWFDERAAQRAVAFFPLVLRHSKGKWARKPVWLEPWQQFVIWQLFGWKRASGLRRFRTVYLEVARKAGKSTLLSGVGLFLLSADGEPGAEVYTAATKIEQARIIHQESIRMVKQSPLLQEELRVMKNNIHNPETFSKYEPLGSNSETLDGLNVSAGLIDELHAHPNGDLWEVIETGTGSREQPVMFAITTAGHNTNSFCFTQHDYTEKILDGTLEDDSWLGLIYSLDRNEQGEIEDWEDEANWVKANPNLGVSKFLDVMRDKAHKAKRQPSLLNGFLTKELNLWTSAVERAISPEDWRLCNFGPVDVAGLAGRRCWMGVDLSSTLDVTAAVLVFEADEGGVRPVLCRFWIPEENIRERVRRDRVPFDVWVRQGLVQTTPGNVIDDAFILAQIRADLGLYDVVEVAYDPWSATWLANQLQADGVEEDRLVAFRQGYASMSPAMAELEKAISRRSFNHGGNGVLVWMSSNLVLTLDPAGNKKPDKSKAREKIDGMVALGMGLYRAVLGEAVQAGSVYEERGVLSV
jgi:phage terminase large subunit-like protein